MKDTDVISLQKLALQRNFWARKRTIMANKRTMLAYVRTGFLIAAVAKEYTKQEWATYGFIFIAFVLLEYIYNTATITGDLDIKKTISMVTEFIFDGYAVGLVVIALIVLGYNVEDV
jgi:uncharacterized membrane protein YidH (DUF202 family)